MSRQMAEPSEQAERAESAAAGGGVWWRRTFRRGWRVGKAAAVAGAVIAAAPVVVPPLLVLSTLGAALSLPFGAYLASLACTDRLMRCLLPPPLSQPPPPHDQEEEEGFLEAAESEEARPLQCIEQPVDDEEVVEEEAKRAAEEVKRHVVENGAKAAEERGRVEAERAVEIEKMDAEITEIEIEANGTGGSPLTPVASDVTQQDENIGDAREVFEEMIVSSREGGVREERVIVVADNLAAGTLEPSGGVVVESVEVVGENEPPGFNSGYASAVEDPSVDTTDVESWSSAEHAGAFIAAGTVVAVEPETAAAFDTEMSQDFYDEAKLWEQLSAMRTIVGYRAAPAPSLAEEMRAIYLFTGVEPPPISSGDVSDLKEINRKLHFLKSVVGVK